MRISERPQWATWVTPKLLRQRPIYRWYVYPHSYDREVVRALLEEFKVKPNSWVWDPFVGSGTTLLACREYGCSAIGTDLLPISVLVTRAKISKYNPKRLAEELDEFSFESPESVSDRFAPVPIVKKALSTKRRHQISHLLNQIDQLPHSSQLFFRVALLRSIEYISVAVKSGGWLRIDPERRVSGVSLRRLFQQHVKLMLEDLNSGTTDYAKGSHLEVKMADARTVKTERPVSACITSPPYLNRHDYTRVFSLELALTGVSSPEELISLRYRTLRSHVEAKPPPFFSNDAIFVPPIVSNLIKQIQSSGTNNIRIPTMIRGYFEDMSLVMRNIARNLRPGGKAALVVGNTRFSGVMIPVDEILAMIGPKVGLEAEKILTTRYRGNSAQQMGTYGREPARESVVIFKKT